MVIATFGGNNHIKINRSVNLDSIKGYFDVGMPNMCFVINLIHRRVVTKLFWNLILIILFTCCHSTSHDAFPLMLANSLLYPMWSNRLYMYNISSICCFSILYTNNIATYMCRKIINAELDEAHDINRKQNLSILGLTLQNKTLFGYR